MELGSYQIIRKIATGGMAEIFLARHKSTEGFQRNLVIKRILPEFSEDASFVQSFLDEAKLAGQLNHPNIVQIYDLGRLGKSYFIAMEYIRGWDISTLLRLERRRKTFLPVGVALRVFCDVCAGLDYAHAAKDVDGNVLGVVHRDVTPSNVIVSADGPAKVVDFGIAKATAKGDGKTKTGTIKGKFAYLAPEQVLGAPVDKRADVFACGIMLYELMANHNPFRGETEYQSLQNIVSGVIKPLSEARPGVPDELDTVIATALARDVDQRFGTCGALCEAVEEVARLRGISMTHADVRAYLDTNQAILTELEAKSRGDGSDLDGSVISAVTGVDSTASDGVTLKRPVWPYMLLGSALLAALIVVFFALQRGSRVIRMASDPPEETAIEVTTDPAGAQVLLDGVLVTGVTPLRVLDVAVGNSYAIELVMPGFRATKSDVKLDKPGLRTVQVALAAEVRKIVPAVVAPSTKKDKERPMTLVSVPATATEPGRLRVTVVPWGTVSIDGKRVGDTPFPPRELSAGDHVVLIENADLGKRVSRRVRVPSGAETSLKEDLTKD